MKVHIRTYGCQMNERDSEAVGVMLAAHGYEPADAEDDADIVIVNTCSVRGKAEEKAIGKLGLMVASKRRHHGRLVGAIGCMVERMGLEIGEKIRGLDFAVGTHRLSALPRVLQAVRDGVGPVVEVGGVEADPGALCGHARGAVSAFVTILQGCNRGCAYCVVPAVRGREWSKPVRAVVEEVEDLVTLGVKEVTLLGQSVTAYGLSSPVWDGEGASRLGLTEPFPRLLEAVAGVEGSRRIRFTSSHPSGCTEELAGAMRDLPAVCEHIHLPLQSGSDRILESMGRGYTADDYRVAVRRLRSFVPEMAVTTDVIVGYPGEREEDFALTRNLMEEIGFDNAFIFKYSPRPGTSAARLTETVTDAEKMGRNQVLLEDQDGRGRRINERLVGREVEVLVEGTSLRNPSRWSGRTRSNKIAVFEARENTRPGDIVRVHVDRAMPQTLYGSIV